MQTYRDCMSQTCLMVRNITTGKTAVNTMENGEMGNPMAEASLSHNQVRPCTAIQLQPSCCYGLLEQ